MTAVPGIEQRGRMADIPTIYTAHDVPDLIATVPTMLGFRPQESLVAIATHGERRRFGFCLRVDIPSVDDVDALGELVAAHLCHQGAEGAVLIALTESQDIAAELLEAVERHLGPIEVVASIRANGDRYWTSEAGSPAEGIGYESSDHHVAVVHAIAAGQEILPDRQALVDRFRAVEHPRRGLLMHASAAVLDQIMPLIHGSGEADLASIGAREVQPIIVRGLAGQRLDDDDVVRLAVWVSIVPVRDEVWRQITPTTARDMLRFLTIVCRGVVPPFEPAVLSLTAFAAWLCGDGAQALIAVERALASDRGYSMAKLILRILEGGVAPSAWVAMPGLSADWATSP